MSDGQSRPDEQPHQLDQLLRDFYAREMQKGLPAELQVSLAGDSDSRVSASGATVSVPATGAENRKFMPAAAGSVKRVRNGMVPAGTGGQTGRMTISRSSKGSDWLPAAGSRAGVTAVTLAACCVLAVAIQLSGRSASPVADGGREPLSSPQAAAGRTESDIVRGSADFRSEGTSRQPVERSGKSRTDARTDGVPVMLGQPEKLPASGGLEIEVPEDPIEVFPIDDPERARNPASVRGESAGDSSSRAAGSRRPVVAPSGK